MKKDIPLFPVICGLLAFSVVTVVFRSVEAANRVRICDQCRKSYTVFEESKKSLNPVDIELKSADKDVPLDLYEFCSRICLDLYISEKNMTSE